jgi:hypothetical protein
LRYTSLDIQSRAREQLAEMVGAGMLLVPELGMGVDEANRFERSRTLRFDRSENLRVSHGGRTSP